MKAVRYSDSPATCATSKFLPYIRTPEKSYVYSWLADMNIKGAEEHILTHYWGIEISTAPMLTPDVSSHCVTGIKGRYFVVAAGREHSRKSDLLILTAISTYGLFLFVHL
ncbi:hypothetical protein I7I51_07292 [Histoplasma capsulatum]|uniref:Uncharacterized protein n=1 Tax=Ajellomyces capsulatus TaxID=5037 RepID=A0A8A1MKQ3_AJECA|nr:hypothetical protein I7I51_07292 [Histoplasma capsulatum]